MEAFWNIFHRVIFGLRIALVLILLVFFAIPIIKAPSNTLRNASLQQARVERIAKDALILEYRPVAERDQAISELQDTLPLWRQEQASLQNVNDPQIQLLLLQSNTDFIPITAALQKILAAQFGPADPVQVNIIMAHEHSYAALLSQIATLIQQDGATLTVQFFAFDLILLLVSIALTIVQSRRKK